MLAALLNSIESCVACNLLTENRKLGIPISKFKCKPEAEFVFIGRDPSPRTAEVVGERNIKSTFIREAFAITDAASITENKVYITDLCKCHWRTSSGGKPIIGTERRSPTLPKEISNICIERWLIREMNILKPKIIFSFGDELYGQLRNYIVKPSLPPRKFSASLDKSIEDAELFFSKGGLMELKLGLHVCEYIALRHAGSSKRLPASSIKDKRKEVYELSKSKAIQRLIELR